MKEELLKLAKALEDFKDLVNGRVEDLVERMNKHRHTSFDDTSRLQRKIPVTVVLGNTSPATAGFYDTFFINKSDFRYVVREIQAVWKTASTSGTLQIQRLQGTEAKGSGDDLLASTIDMSGTAETVNKGSLTASRDLLELQKGDRLCLENAGTLTNQVNLVVTVYLEQI